jgi:branched-subunit amino acid aminotransferase/4-amino-4-deoxychorismate lyase
MTVLLLNGVVVDAAEAKVPATDRALTHGLGLYETLKLVGGVPVFFAEHTARLASGLTELGLRRPVEHAELAAQICRISAASGVRDGACRLLVTAGPPDGPPSLIIQTDTRTFPARPLRVIAYRGVRVSASLKAMTVMQSYLAQQAALKAGVDDAILVDDDGRIFEGATSNMFIVREGGLITPPAEGAILPGVLRAQVEELATRDGVAVVEAYLRVADLRPDDGMLLTSSVRGIVAVETVDDVLLKEDEELLARLRSLLGAALAARAEAFRRQYL